MGSLLLVICLVFSSCTKQQDALEKDFEVYLSENGDGVMIGFYKGKKKKVFIPSEFKGQPVTEISYLVFRDKGITSVTIPDTVKQICQEAFANNKLSNVTFPDSLIFIGSRAFFDNELTGIVIPNSVTLIEREAFALNKITSITIGSNVRIEASVSETRVSFGDAFEYNFYDYYLKNRMRAGTYTYYNYNWTFEPTEDYSAETENFDASYIEQMLQIYDNKLWEKTMVESYYIKEASASSSLSDSQGKYPASNLIDQTWRSWAEGVKGNGKGESFAIAMSISKEIAGFAIKNGYGNLDHYGRNNRVKSFKIYIDDKYTETIEVKDSISFEQYAFKASVNCEKIRFEIDEVYPGTSFDDTCVAEIALLRKIVSDSEFYENILFWFDSDRYEYFESHSKDIVSVSDIDRLLIIEYLPFDNLVEHVSYPKTKVALLGSPSLLKLTENLPRLDGATAMYPLYSSFVRAVYPEIDLVKDKDSDGYSYISSWSVFNWPYYPTPSRLSHGDEEGEKFTNIVQCSTTSEAYRRLIDGETDIIFCYEPSQADKNAAAAKGKSFSLTPIAKDAFVFIVNEKNVLNNITQKQVRDIYSGRTTNWKPVSGADEPVIAYQRRENSGSQTIFQTIMKEEKIIRPPLDGEYVSMGMSGMLNKVTSDFYNYNSAIGYTFLFYLAQMAGSGGIKALSVDGAAPSRENIQKGAYPFTQTVYAITTGKESENTKKFIEWILSAQGQELVAKTGYTPIK